MILAIICAAVMDMYDVSQTISMPFVIIVVLVGLYILPTIKVAPQWEKAVVLRFGKFHNL
jgi:regulator of protease activity HflC (stomatin/prohibitin superfamily)